MYVEIVLFNTQKDFIYFYLFLKVLNNACIETNYFPHFRLFTNISFNIYRLLKIN